MINVRLPKRVKGDKLADTVEFAMRELPEFNVQRQPVTLYGPDSKKKEVKRALTARKKTKWYDPLIVASGCAGGLGAIAYLIPFIGQALYVGIFLFPDMRRCVIKTKIDLDKEYDGLNLWVGRGIYIDMTCENFGYKFVKDDVEKFISNLNKKLSE